MKGIIFSTELVPHVLDSTKRVTRRRMNPQPGPDVIALIPHGEEWLERVKGSLRGDVQRRHRSPYKVGEIRYLRETYTLDWWQAASLIVYKADVKDPNAVYDPVLNETTKPYWKSSRSLPEWASRAKLKIKSVRAEQVQDITYDDIVLEGWDARKSQPMTDRTAGEDARDWYASIWDRINGRGSWARNDWSWRIEFERTEAK